MLQNSLKHSETTTQASVLDFGHHTEIASASHSHAFNGSGERAQKVQGMIHRLNTGQVIPAVGLGTFQDPDEQEASVLTALHCGFRHIDTAHK